MGIRRSPTGMMEFKNSYVHLKKSEKKSGYFFGFFSGYFSGYFFPLLLHKKLRVFFWIFLSRKFFYIFLSRKKIPQKICIFYAVKMEKISKNNVQQKFQKKSKKYLKRYPIFFSDFFRWM